MKIKGLLYSLVLFMPVICTSQILLDGPQKIVIDVPRNLLLVSNGNSGDLIQIDSAGNQDYFVADADFIDGLEIVGDTIYGVGDKRVIHAYNLVTKDSLYSITIPGNSFKYLSSITSDSAGHLFISCPDLNEIYKLRISDQSNWVFVSGNGLSKPNGILLEKEKKRIVVIGDTLVPSNIYAISLADSTVSILDTLNLKRPDGIVRDKYGYYYIGGFYLAGVYMTDATFSYDPELFFEGDHIVYPTYDARDHSLLVTYYNANSWGRVPLTTTGITGQGMPPEFNLSPVFPNPINADLSIRYDLNKRSRVRLDFYNSSGTLVANLLNEDQEPGNHTETWNGIDSTGNHVPSGVYFLRMTVNGVTQTQKVMMMR